MSLNLTKTELNKWYKDDYVQIASHPVRAVGEWSIITVSSPYSSKTDWFLHEYVLRNNKVMFMVPYNHTHTPELWGISWSAYDPKTNKWVDVAGKYSLKTFLQKAHNLEISQDFKLLTIRDLWNKYKIPLPVMYKLGYDKWVR